MLEKDIRRGICLSVYWYPTANNKYTEDYDKSIVKYWHVNNLYNWAMSQKLPLHNFEWIKDTSQFNEDLNKNYDEERDEGYFLEVYIQYL